jgi:hypothetical protein
MWPGLVGGCEKAFLEGAEQLPLCGFRSERYPGVRVDLSGKAWDFVKLPQRREAAAFLAIANDLESVASSARDPIELLGARRIDIRQMRFPISRFLVAPPGKALRTLRFHAGSA